MGTAMTVMAIGLLLSSRIVADTPYVLLAVCLLAVSIGLGLGMMPGTDSIMGAVPRGRAGIGSATNDTTREIGCALGVAVLGSVLSSGYRDSIGRQLAGLGPQVEARVRDSIGAASVVAHGLTSGPAAEVARVANAAFMSGMSAAMTIGALVVGIAAAALYGWLPGRAAEPETTAPESRGAAVADDRGAAPA